MYKSLTLSPHASFLLYTHSLGASQKKKKNMDSLL